MSLEQSLPEKHENSAHHGDGQFESQGAGAAHDHHATMPVNVEILADKERSAELKQGPPLKPEERADLFSWRQFPHDSDKQELARREILATLSPKEKNELESARTREHAERTGKAGHSRDLSEPAQLQGHYQDLANKERNGELSRQDADDLASKRQFPNDQHYQDIARKELLYSDGLGSKPTPEETADLASKRQYPDNEHYRELARQELLSADGKAPKLHAEQVADLASKRQFPYDVNNQELARRERLALSADEQTSLNQACMQRAQRHEPAHA